MKKIAFLLLTLCSSLVYAGKKMDYTDERGQRYSDSYWELVQFNLSPTDKSLHVIFYGYKDLDSFKAGKQSIGTIDYSVSGEKVFDYVDAPVMDLLYDRAFKIPLAGNNPFSTATETTSPLIDKLHKK